MATRRADSFLWFHLAAIAAVPLGLEVCLLGLAVGQPLLPGSLDCLLVGLVGAVPLLALQWLRPIYPFSVPFASLRPGSLSSFQLKLLTMTRGLVMKGMALAAAILGLLLLRLAYRWSPIAAEVVAEVLPLESRWAGLGIAIAAFFLTNLWLQMGLGSALMLITPGGMVDGTEAFPLDGVDRGFFRWGIPLSQLLYSSPQDALDPEVSGEDVAIDEEMTTSEEVDPEGEEEAIAEDDETPDPEGLETGGDDTDGEPLVEPGDEGGEPAEALDTAVEVVVDDGDGEPQDEPADESAEEPVSDGGEGQDN